MRTDASPATPSPDSEAPANATLAQESAATVAKPEAAAPQLLSHGPETQPLPPSQPDDVHIQVEAPIVFRGKSSSAAAPTPANEAAAQPVKESPTQPIQPEAQVQPPPAAPPTQPKPEHRGVLHRIGRFFSAIWR
jgi:hypothetical protein